jgi:hypothetical protein
VALGNGSTFEPYTDAAPHLLEELVLLSCKTLQLHADFPLQEPGESSILINKYSTSRNNLLTLLQCKP